MFTCSYIIAPMCSIMFKPHQLPLAGFINPKIKNAHLFVYICSACSKHQFLVIIPRAKGGKETKEEPNSCRLAARQCYRGIYNFLNGLDNNPPPHESMPTACACNVVFKIFITPDSCESTLQKKKTRSWKFLKFYFQQTQEQTRKGGNPEASKHLNNKLTITVWTSQNPF